MGESDGAWHTVFVSNCVVYARKGTRVFFLEVGVHDTLSECKFNINKVTGELFRLTRVTVGLSILLCKERLLHVNFDFKLEILLSLIHI